MQKISLSINFQLRSLAIVFIFIGQACNLFCPPRLASFKGYREKVREALSASFSLKRAEEAAAEKVNSYRSETLEEKAKRTASYFNHLRTGPVKYSPKVNRMLILVYDAQVDLCDCALKVRNACMGLVDSSCPDQALDAILELFLLKTDVFLRQLSAKKACERFLIEVLGDGCDDGLKEAALEEFFTIILEVDVLVGLVMDICQSNKEKVAGIIEKLPRDLQAFVASFKEVNAVRINSHAKALADSL